MSFIINFLHFAGIIIALGSVTVIDTMGFFSRKSKYQTQVTIEAHHITKPLIWIGTIPMAISWFFLYDGSILSIWKSILITIVILNGAFLSFYISPNLDKLIGKKVLIPWKLQSKIILSMLLSFICWWSIVVITVLQW